MRQGGAVRTLCETRLVISSHRRRGRKLRYKRHRNHRLYCSIAGIRGRLNLTEDKMHLDEVVEDPSEIFVMAVVEGVHALHTLCPTYELSSLHPF